MKMGRRLKPEQEDDFPILVAMSTEGSRDPTHKRRAGRAALRRSKRLSRSRSCRVGDQRSQAGIGHHREFERWWRQKEMSGDGGRREKIKDGDR